LIREAAVLAESRGAKVLKLESPGDAAECGELTGALQRLSFLGGEGRRRLSELVALLSNARVRVPSLPSLEVPA
jgi:hypothetical protein